MNTFGPKIKGSRDFKIYFILGSHKFLAFLERIRSYAWYFGHSDPDPSSVCCFSLPNEKVSNFLLPLVRKL